MIDPKVFFIEDPIPPISKVRFPDHDREISMLRLDLAAPKISGNKYWKLKYHFLKAAEKKSGLIGIGGPYSNLLHALAEGGHLFGIPTTGLLSGPEPKELTPTLKDCRNWGMKLEFIDRQEFKNLNQKSDEDLNYQGQEVIPLGANDALGLQGTQEVLKQIPREFTTILCAMGTGNTFKGLVLSSSPGTRVIGIPVLKGIKNELEKDEDLLTSSSNWEILEGYEFGGFARFPDQLLKFVKAFEEMNSIPMDPIYTAKLAFATWDLLKRGSLESQDKVIMIHSGGLQGRRGFPNLVAS